jgi:hypothetical protein
LADVEARGKALRAEVEKFYAPAPETRKSLLRKMLAPPYVGAAAYDFGRTVQNYIPAGTSFDEAVRILKAAGMTIFLPPIRIGTELKGHTIEAELERYTDQPAGYMRFRVELYPRQDNSDADLVVGKIDAWLEKYAGAPVPPVNFVLDAAKPATMQATIKVVDDRFYEFDLAFHATRLDQLENIRKLAGDAYLGPGIETRPPRNPGVVIPLHVVVTTEAQHVIYDRTRDTLGTYKGSRMRVHRKVGGLQLAPGLYHVRVSTLKDIPELADVAVEFSVSWDARF